MAAKNSNPTSTMCIVNGQWLLPVDEAIKLVDILARAAKVESHYVGGNVGYTYKYSNRSDSNTNQILTLTMAQLAAITLETD